MFTFTVSGATLDEARTNLMALHDKLSGTSSSDAVTSGTTGGTARRTPPAIAGAKKDENPKEETKVVEEKKDEAPALKPDEVKAAIVEFAKAKGPATLKERAASILNQFKDKKGKDVTKFDDMQPEDYQAALDAVAKAKEADEAGSGDDI